jgi:hypothetical protein
MYECWGEECVCMSVGGRSVCVFEYVHVCM